MCHRIPTRSVTPLCQRERRMRDLVSMVFAVAVWLSAFTHPAAANGPTFKTAQSGPVIGGTYNVHGTNANGTRYIGTVVIKTEGSIYRFSWLISNGLPAPLSRAPDRSFAAALTREFSGSGRFKNNKIVVNCGYKYPIIYEIGAEGNLNGTWDNGRASETLLRVYWPTSDAPRPAGALDARPFERAGADHWQGLCRRSLVSGSLSQFS
jgi:hypothetical protein